MDTERKNDIKAAAKRTEAQGPFSDRSLSRAVFSTLRMCALCIRYKSILAVAGQSAPTAWADPTSWIPPRAARRKFTFLLLVLGVRKKVRRCVQAHVAVQGRVGSRTEAKACCVLGKDRVCKQTTFLRFRRKSSFQTAGKNRLI